MPSSPIATAADYADAMMSARRAKNALFLVLVLIILAQVTIFIVLRRSPPLMEQATAAAVATERATTQPLLSQSTLVRTLEYVTAICDFLGLVLSIVLCFVLLLLTMIMLVGRLIGVSKVTSAFIGSLLLVVLLFPWQAVLMTPLTPSNGVETRFKVPGVLYTWSEVTNPTYGATFSTDGKQPTFTILRWARFTVWPAVALVLLLTIQGRSSRGLRLALGEVEFDVAEGTAGM
jgi:hypothetical protein